MISPLKNVECVDFYIPHCGRFLESPWRQANALEMVIDFNHFIIINFSS
jgi:hypothetical protein